MTGRCASCGKSIDPAHDGHYNCPRCADAGPLYCPACRPQSGRCPLCEEKLRFKEESLTRKAFFNPATRGLLGF